MVLMGAEPPHTLSPMLLPTHQLLDSCSFWCSYPTLILHKGSTEHFKKARSTKNLNKRKRFQWTIFISCYVWAVAQQVICPIFSPSRVNLTVMCVVCLMMVEITVNECHTIFGVFPRIAISKQCLIIKHC